MTRWARVLALALMVPVAGLAQAATPLFLKSQQFVSMR